MTEKPETIIRDEADMVAALDALETPQRVTRKRKDHDKHGYENPRNPPPQFAESTDPQERAAAMEDWDEERAIRSEARQRQAERLTRPPLPAPGWAAKRVDQTPEEAAPISEDLKSLRALTAQALGIGREFGDTGAVPRVEGLRLTQVDCFTLNFSAGRPQLTIKCDFVGPPHAHQRLVDVARKIAIEHLRDNPDLARHHNLRNALAETEKAVAVAEATVAELAAKRARLVIEAGPRLAAELVAIDKKLAVARQTAQTKKEEAIALEPVAAEATSKAQDTARRALEQGVALAEAGLRRQISKLVNDAFELARAGLHEAATILDSVSHSPGQGVLGLAAAELLTAPLPPADPPAVQPAPEVVQPAPEPSPGGLFATIADPSQAIQE